MSDSEDNFSSDEDVAGFDSDFDDEKENVKPKKTKAKKTTDDAEKPKKTTAKRSKKADDADKPKKPRATKPKKAASDEEMDDAEDKPKKRGGAKKKAQAEDYVKLDQIEHALKRPDMYIGNATLIQQKMWVWDSPEGMNQRDISFVPGLYKIFDEILVNAADNKQRDDSMSEIRVTIDEEKGEISVYNDGQGIPVEMHPKEKMYVPTMIFGHLLTGSNFDDTVKKVTGGRNGLGAKLANIFSNEFTVETLDSERGKLFKQTWKDNLSDHGEPSVKSSAKKTSYTKITFVPDLKRFGMDSFDKDIVALMTKRVYDIAGCNPGLKVSLNGEKLKIKDFKAYCELYLKDPSKPKIFAQVNDRWSVCVSISDGEFQQVSFVNSICTIRGGTHVTHVVNKLAKALGPVVKKKNKGAEVKPAQIKSHLWVFVNSLIENPGFDSQTKETLTTPPKDFGSSCDLDEAFLKKVLKCGVVENILLYAKAKSAIELKKHSSGKKTKRLTGITKLDDANNAGTKNSDKCTLILTEGDSAKSLAVSGLSVIGRDNYGVFPLRGKLLNVREASHAKLVKNEEITSIVQIMGLKFGEKYTNTKSLRYGHLMIMTDQDVDGSHIKGLIINFIHFYWPELLKIDGFMREFITPIVKAKKGKQVLTFFTLPEYYDWKKEVQEKGEKGWNIKYYKGLGTSDKTEAKEYFSDLDTHQLDFSWSGDSDGKNIDMAFGKDADARKEWMRKFKPGTFLDSSVKDVTYSDFINKELILFSLEDCARSVPSVVDGLKPGQRKVLFACFKRNLKKELKVAQLSGYVAENSAYLHGEASLQSTIVNMAQNFVGANNINLLQPNGQFGTRLQGGKDAASARYIHTCLAKLTRQLFNASDDKVLTYLDEEGMSIEPEWYIPIIPMVLVNGAEGIGTGWSTSVPNYNPKDIVDNLKRLSKGEDLVPMHPWYRGFKGKIELDTKKGNYVVTGIWNQSDADTIEITELPIGMWTQTYKEFLENLLQGTDKQEPMIKDYKEYHTDAAVHFRVEFLEGKLKTLMASNTFETKMKLVSKISVSNMTLFDPEGRIRKYANPEEILREFYDLRLKYYEKRKDFLVNELNEQWSMLDNKVRFILAVIAEEIIIRNRKRQDLLKELANKKFVPFYKKRDPKKAKTAKDDEEEEIDEDDDEETKKEKKETANNNSTGYEYLLGMPLWSLTLERVQQLRDQLKKKEDELKELIETPTKTLWSRDLESFMPAFDEWCLEEEDIANNFKPTKGKGRARKAVPKKRKPVSDDEDDDDFADSKKKKAPGVITKPRVTAAKPVVEKEEKKKDTKKEETKKEETKKEEGKKDLKFGTFGSIKLSSIVKGKGEEKEEKTTAKKSKTESAASKVKDTKIDSFFKKKKKEDSSEDEDDKVISMTKGLGGNKSEEEDDFMDLDSPKKPAKAAPVKKTTTKPIAIESSDEEEEEKKKPTRKTATRASSKKKKEESSDEEEEESEEEDSVDYGSESESDEDLYDKSDDE